MGRLVLSDAIRGTFDAIFRPAKFVEANVVEFGGSFRDQFRQVRKLALVFLANLALYAGPLTVAGYGRQSIPAMPGWVAAAVPLGEPVQTWQFVAGFALNCAYILAATTITLVTFHVVVVFTRQSRGFLSSMYSVIYSTSAYLAGIFTVVWYLSLTDGVSAARTVVLNLQRAFVYWVITVLGADVGLPGGRPSGIPLADISPQGSLLLTLLVLLTTYYLYSMYLGSRINHGSNRLYSLLTVVAVGVSPVIYVAASVLAATGGGFN